jgi:hypothetical protein
MIEIIKRERDGRYVPVKVTKLACGSTNYEVSCDCVTKRFAGWNFRAVIEHPKGYSHYSSARRSAINKFGYVGNS